MADHNATPKSLTLGAALREARDAKKITLRELGTALDYDYSRLGKFERGEQVPPDTVAARILTQLGVTGERFEEILGMTKAADAPQWFAVSLPERRQHLDALLGFEASAQAVTSVSPLLIPGLLQIPGYVRGIMTGGTVPPDEIATRVVTRLGRREHITRSQNPAKYVAYIGEGALRQVIGDADVMIEQLEFLLAEAKRPNVTVRAMPFDSGWHAGLEGPFTMIEPRPDAERAVMTVVNLETRRSGVLLHSVDDIKDYREAVDTVEQAAMSPADTEGLIADVIKGMRTG